MELAMIVFRQTLVMFLFMLAGFALFKGKKITVQGSRDMAALLLWLVVPTVLLNSFCVEFSVEKLRLFALSSLLGALALLLAMAAARLLYRDRPIDDLAAAFSNCGFMGIPLVQAAVGQEAVFFLVGIIAIMNVLQWTYGVRVLTGKKGPVSLKFILCNPILAGTLIGLVLFVTGLGARLPSVVSSTLSGIAAMNAPLGMLILGCYLAQTRLGDIFTTPRLYWLSAARLILIPLITLLVFWPLPVEREIKLAVFLSASAPVGVNVAVYAQLHGLDYPYACQTISLSTLLSTVTLPLMLLAANLVL